MGSCVSAKDIKVLTILFRSPKKMYSKKPMTSLIKLIRIIKGLLIETLSNSFLKIIVSHAIKFL